MEMWFRFPDAIESIIEKWWNSAIYLIYRLVDEIIAFSILVSVVCIRTQLNSYDFLSWVLKTNRSIPRKILSAYNLPKIFSRPSYYETEINILIISCLSHAPAFWFRTRLSQYIYFMRWKMFLHWLDERKKHLVGNGLFSLMNLGNSYHVNRLSKYKIILGVLKFEQRLSPTFLVCLCYSSLNNLFNLLRCPFSVARWFAKYL